MRVVLLMLSLLMLAGCGVSAVAQTPEPSPSPTKVDYRPWKDAMDNWVHHYCQTNPVYADPNGKALIFAYPDGFDARRNSWGPPCWTLACIITAAEGLPVNGYFDADLRRVLRPFLPDHR